MPSVPCRDDSWAVEITSYGELPQRGGVSDLAAPQQATTDPADDVPEVTSFPHPFKNVPPGVRAASPTGAVIHRINKTPFHEKMPLDFILLQIWSADADSSQILENRRRDCSGGSLTKENPWDSTTWRVGDHQALYSPLSIINGKEVHRLEIIPASCSVSYDCQIDDANDEHYHRFQAPSFTQRSRWEQEQTRQKRTPEKANQRQETPPERFSRK